MKIKEVLKKSVALALMTIMVAATPANINAASWQQNNTGWWWLEDDGSYPASTWKSINGKWYYFDSYGYMLGEGWHWINGKCYYMYAGGANASDTWIDGSYVDASGAWVPGAQPAQWMITNGRWWYLNEDGSYPANEWKAINGKWYYFDAEGWMLDKGWHWIDGKCYYMYAGGANASDTWIDGYYVNVSGEWVPPKDQWISSGKRWWYKHGDGSYIFSVVLSVLDKFARLVKLITSGLSDIFPFPAFFRKLWNIQNARMVVDSKVDTLHHATVY